MSFIMIYATYKNIKEAEKAASYLLKNKLIASSMMLPINLHYWWEGKLKKSKEIMLILETQSKNWLRVKFEIKRMHSYKLPCIIKKTVTAYKDYEQWVFKETS